MTLLVQMAYRKFSGTCGWSPVLALEVLPRPESIALLRMHRPELAEDDADWNAHRGRMARVQKES